MKLEELLKMEFKTDDNGEIITVGDVWKTFSRAERRRIERFIKKRKSIGNFQNLIDKEKEEEK